MTQQLFLKIKIKSLAEEARIIRHQERKLRDKNHRYWSERRERLRRLVHEHRVLDVRRETRATLLAYGFLRNRRLSQLERYPRAVPAEIWERVYSMLKKYGGLNAGDARKKVAGWLNASL